MIIQWKVSIPTLAPDLERRAYVYLPEDWEKSGKRYDVMYMYDGHNVFFDSHATYGKSWGMKEYLDAAKKDLIVVGIECNPEGNERLFEYCPFDCQIPGWIAIEGRGKVYMDWLVGTLKPYIDANYPTNPGREHTIVAGSSMGGLMALYGACEYNHVFKKAACLSPSFWVSKDKILQMVTHAEIDTNTCIYIDYGSMELPNHELNSEALISVARSLLTKHVNVALRIIPGGTHSERSWEKQIPVFMDCLGL